QSGIAPIKPGVERGDGVEAICDRHAGRASGGTGERVAREAFLRPRRAEGLATRAQWAGSRARNPDPGTGPEARNASILIASTLSPPFLRASLASALQLLRQIWRESRPRGFRRSRHRARRPRR